MHVKDGGMSMELMTETEVGRAELVGRAVALREGLWADAAECDRLRRLTERSIGGVSDAGLMRLLTPRRYGGYEADMRTFLDVTIELGRGCCSTAWVTGVLNVGNFVVSLFPVVTQDRVWGDDPVARSALVLGSAGAKVERAGDGVRITGQWPYASGSLHAEWVAVLVAVPTGKGAPQVSLALVPIGQVQLRDTWHFTGMRGTGSGTVCIDRVEVPPARLLPFLPLFNGEADSIVEAGHPYRNSLAGLFAVGLIGPMIGTAHAALNHVLDKGRTRPVAFSAYGTQAESPTFQLGVAEAARRLETAKLHARRIADAVDEYATAGGNPDLLTRATLRMDSAFVAQQCREAVDALVTAYGTSAFDETNPLQRIWRDINVASRHVAFGMGIPEQLYGRALIGQDPRQISYLV
jgi:3-hydroxy-9,10-secoandrosta-1,3,5(10)-triene-9,17-dione monooxygenase